MPSSTVTSKGQITLPLEVRTRLGLRRGSRVEFVETTPGRYELHVPVSSVRDLRGMVPVPSRRVSVEDMDAAIAAETAGRQP